MPPESRASLEDRIIISTPEGAELELQLAGLGSRFIAEFIDVIIQLVLIGILAIITGAGTGGGLNTVAMLIGTFVIWFFYFIPFEVLWAGQTPGKRLAHLRVVRESGTPVDLAASAIRNLVRVLDGITLAYLPSIIAVLITARNQRPGDLAAGTLVIRDPGERRKRRRPWRRRRRGSQSELGGVGAGGVGAGGVGAGRAGGAGGAGGSGAAAWDVTGVTAEELSAVRRFLERRETLDPKARGALALRLARALLAKVPGARASGDPEIFLEQLVEAKSRRGSV